MKIAGAAVVVGVLVVCRTAGAQHKPGRRHHEEPAPAPAPAEPLTSAPAPPPAAPPPAAPPPGTAWPSAPPEPPIHSEVNRDGPWVGAGLSVVFGGVPGARVELGVPIPSEDLPGLRLVFPMFGYYQ